MKLTIVIDEQDALDPSAIADSTPLTLTARLDRGDIGEDDVLDLYPGDSGVLTGEDAGELLSSLSSSPGFRDLAFRGANLGRVLAVARGLCDHEATTENPEYARAIVEFASDMLRLGNARADDYAAIEKLVLG